MSDQKSPVQDCVTVNIVTKEQLYAAYMPYVNQGGLFIHTTREFKFGDHVLLKLQLLDDQQLYELTAEIIWITPSGAQYGMQAGIGVRFLDEQLANTLQSKITTHLAGMNKSQLLTETM